MRSGEDVFFWWVGKHMPFGSEFMEFYDGNSELNIHRFDSGDESCVHYYGFN